MKYYGALKKELRHGKIPAYTTVMIFRIYTNEKSKMEASIQHIPVYLTGGDIHIYVIVYTKKEPWKDKA